jgi:hypothetical protein
VELMSLSLCAILLDRVVFIIIIFSHFNFPT